MASATHAPAHSLSAEEAALQLDVSPSVGLSTTEAELRLKRYGPNAIAEEPSTPWWKLVLAQFDDLLVKILLGAALVSFCLALSEEDARARWHAMVEPLVIVVILVILVKRSHWWDKEGATRVEWGGYPRNESAILQTGGDYSRSCWRADGAYEAHLTHRHYTLRRRRLAADVETSDNVARSELLARRINSL